jgi:hypothetical protein
LFAATAILGLMLSWDGDAPAVSSAQARLGRPLTPFSVAGVHRRAMRRNFGVAWRHPVARAAAIGAVGYGAGYYGGGCTCGAPGYGGWSSGAGFQPGFGWGAPGVGVGWGPGFGGWGSGFGVQPGFGFGEPGFGLRRGWF